MKKTLAILVGFLLVISMVGCSTSGTSGKSAETDSPKSSNSIEFENIVLKTDMGMTTVIGEAINNDSKAHSFTFKISFYDEGDKLLGSAVGAINNLNGGEMRIFNAIATEDYSQASSYKAQVDAMVSTTDNQPNIIEFSNTIVKSDMGFTTIEGEAKNLDNKDHSFTIVIGFYDKDKNLLGSAVGTMNDLTAGDTKVFSAMATEDYSQADSYIVQVDTIVE
ncbi:FxLYD domain-containing protein [uncultured Tissierella sp.]|uniref:FxLYD domain-containing protein n=1 Tax=uncultured Tissierella sp. TaxID=448160 RepID=UPI0028039908|nr:FxLYD domain-containing protein [uncultured Tissierella sp.]MDU5080288.1 FxLYD domain-containing protein [Bacillota bacterium]